LGDGQFIREDCVGKETVLMIRTLILSGLFAFSLSFGACQSHCKKMQKTNQKLIGGNHDFGKKKEAKKYKRMNRK
jgi:hypothetical protein